MKIKPESSEAKIPFHHPLDFAPEIGFWPVSELLFGFFYDVVAVHGEDVEIGFHAF